MPFRYGIATMTAVPHAFLSVVIETAGATHRGIAADHLPPKWFTKDPSRDTAAEIGDMVQVIRRAMDTARDLAAPTPFALWLELYGRQAEWAEKQGIPPLLAHLGTSLVERALLDAWARARRAPLHRLLAEGMLGLDLGEIHPELAGSRTADWLPASPLAKVTVRHTVGLSDPLTVAGIAPEDRVNDGLPQALEECIRTYGLKHFKLKVRGRIEEDVDRLERIAGVLDEHAPEDYACSLDGNECFDGIGSFVEFLAKASSRPRVSGLLRRTLFVEQPFSRMIALTPAIGNLRQGRGERPPLIIDESDAGTTSLATALALGYDGTSHKNCKGVFKGVANACRIAQLRRAHPASRFLISGEDLSNIGPIALPQDLAVQAALGIASVERNGHHYFAGLSIWPEAVRDEMATAHPDLYCRPSGGWPRLAIDHGEIKIATVNAAPFGVSPVFRPESFATLVAT